jgi:hypothetical protein
MVIGDQVGEHMLAELAEGAAEELLCRLVGGAKAIFHV